MNKLIGRVFTRALGVRSIAILITICTLALVVLSPFALREIALLPGMSWARLSNVGQTYGGVSALLTALALVGVVLSLLYQARDVNIGKEQAHRELHYALLKLQLEDPVYMEVLGPPWGLDIKSDYDSLRQFIVANMWITFWVSRFRLNEMSEAEIREGARELFDSIPGRNYWSAVRAAGGPNLQPGRRARQFIRFLDEEYKKASIIGPPQGVSLSPKTHTPTKHSSQESVLHGGKLVISIAAAVAIGQLISDGLKRHIDRYRS